MQAPTRCFLRKNVSTVWRVGLFVESYTEFLGVSNYSIPRTTQRLALGTKLD